MTAAKAAARRSTISSTEAVVVTSMGDFLLGQRELYRCRVQPEVCLFVQGVDSMAQSTKGAVDDLQTSTQGTRRAVNEQADSLQDGVDAGADALKDAIDSGSSAAQDAADEFEKRAAAAADRADANLQEAGSELLTRDWLR